MKQIETTVGSTELQTMAPSDAMMNTLFNPAVFEQMQRAAGLFAKSGLVPATFKDNMPACFVGLQLAAQLGVNPFMLFQKIYAVQGKIGIEAQVAIAVANQRQVFKGPIEYLFEGEGKTRKCTATAILARGGKAVSLSLTWTEVEAEGWNKKGGSKWLTIPDQMFRYRTALWLIRTYAPEVLMGLNSIDELDDIGVIDITPTKVVTVEPEKPLSVKDKLDAKKKPVTLTDPQKAVEALGPLAPRAMARVTDKPLADLTEAECSRVLDMAAVIEAEDKAEAERGF